MIDSYVQNIQNAKSVLEIEKIVAQAIVDGEYDSKIADEAEHILNEESARILPSSIGGR